MIKHIVMMKFFDFADGRNKSENLKIAKAMIDGFSESIPGIVEMKCGINVYMPESPKAFDIVIDSIFYNFEDLETYKNHNIHLELVEFLNKVREKTHYVDYIF